MLLSTLAAGAITAYGTNDGPAAPPQLNAAQAAAFVGDCADLTAKILALCACLEEARYGTAGSAIDAASFPRQ